MNFYFFLSSSSLFFYGYFNEFCVFATRIHLNGLSFSVCYCQFLFHLNGMLLRNCHERCASQVQSISQRHTQQQQYTVLK